MPKRSIVVTKKEIVKTISDEIGLTQLKTKEIVQKTFDAIVEALVEEGRIELRNFGVFEVKKRAARKARNPRTGDKVHVPEKFVVTFKPGKEMEERVRKLEEKAAAERARQESAAPEAPRAAALSQPAIADHQPSRMGLAADATSFPRRYEGNPGA
jgi:nucleoid DNA-binding protein